ncbi:MAG: hypothetical protein IJV05_10685 [Muribaculaceae bacterium]|nr:hypothetical protein [Muribaculaceae bacterium]
MKKFYFVLAALAAMAVNAQAQNVKTGAIEVGDYANPTEIYNGSFFDVAPTNFYLAHTGAQMIYTTDELADLQGKGDVTITGISFKFRDDEGYDDITRNYKIYMQAIDETEFAVIEGVKQFFEFENTVYEANVTYPLLDLLYEDVEFTFDLDVPFLLPEGKNLLVTFVADADDDDNCTWGTDYVPFYTSGIRGHAMTYTDNWTSFIDYAQGNDFPDATAMLGCGTNVELPVTLIEYQYSTMTAVEEVKAATIQDGAYYNMMGLKFSEGNLPAGIYIHNGQKILVK